MTPRQKWLCVRLPLAILGVYLLGMISVPKPTGLLWTLAFSEQSVIELGTAMGFFLAFGVAVRLGCRHHGLPRVWFAFFAVAALFVALEEISYGQHLFGWQSPEWFKSHSAKETPETNLHNLYGHKPAHLLNAAATVAFPMAFLVFPWLYRRCFGETAWSRAVMPHWELTLLVVLAQSATWFDDIARVAGSDNFWARATELKELYWSLTALGYTTIFSERTADGCDVADSMSHSRRPNDSSFPGRDSSFRGRFTIPFPVNITRNRKRA